MTKQKRRSTGQTLGRTFQAERLRDRFAALAPDDPLWPLMGEMLDAYVLSESAASVTPGLSDGEAHRFRGRVGMLLDLRADLEKVWREAHTPAEQK